MISFILLIFAYILGRISILMKSLTYLNETITEMLVQWQPS